MATIVMMSGLRPQVLCVGYGLVQDGPFTPEAPQLQFEEADVLHPLVVVEVPLAQDGLLDPDLLVQKCPFIVAT